MTGLLSAAAVRERCRMVLDAGLAGKLAHFDVKMERLDATAAYVAETIRTNYPSLSVPFHARWRHFVVEGQDRWDGAVREGSIPADPAERARMRFELAITSVLLDAGAGPSWQWAEAIAEADGQARWLHIGRSEGLALASFNAWHRGYFTSRLDRPRRADATGLATFSAVDLAKAFMVSADNPLDGLEGRAALLQKLGEAIAARPDLFGAEGRLGGLYDTLVARSRSSSHPTSAASTSRDGGRREAGQRKLPAPEILNLLLEALGPIWPGRITLGGVNLGDTWRHPVVRAPGATDGLVPFHKLSQWLSYSLIEPLQEAGLEVTDIEGLTGLAEYRNGGLFVDAGVLVPRSSALLATPHQPGDEPIVEWRALTVSLLDEIAPRVRAVLGLTREQLPLAAVLEGGTWSAGRRIAREKRADGGPPITIVSDGSVF